MPNTDKPDAGRNKAQPTRPPDSAGAESERGETLPQATVADVGRKHGLPQVFGRYRVQRLLGGGGMGAVYLVVNTELEREEALKVPHFDAADDPDVHERFVREAKAAAKLDHANLCPIYDVGVFDGVCYLTMRYLKGKLLSEYGGAAQPVRKAVEIVTKLAQALTAAHAKGVIHRDLKPNNIMMCAGVGPVVMDFGLAKQANRQDRALTQAGTTLGTPAYMPPEQVKGELERMGPASDVYSLGVILFQLLTGRLPFEGGTAAEVYGKILYTEAPVPSTLRPGLPPALDAICARAMAKAPEGRYRSMREFAAALVEYLKAAPATESAAGSKTAKGVPADIFQAATVVPVRTTPAPNRVKVPNEATRTRTKTPPPARKSDGARRDGPRAADAGPAEARGRRSSGGVFVRVLCGVLILGALGGVGALVWALNQRGSATTGVKPPGRMPWDAPAAGREDEGATPHPYLVAVGVGNYQDRQILSRPHAEDDAKAFFDLFTGKQYDGVDASHARLLLGAEDATRGSRPATRENILDALRWLAREAGPQDPVIFSFFGEGAPLGDLGDRHGYLAADSTLRGREKDSVADAEISEALKGLKSRDFAVFLDVNFNGFTPPADGKPVPEASFADRPFAEFRGDPGPGEGQEWPPGRVVFLANRPTSPSLDGPDHGLFATAVLDALKGAADAEGGEADGLVTVDELAAYLDKEVPALARKYGATDKEKEQAAIVLDAPNTHFVLSYNPDPYRKALEELDRFEKLVRDGRVTAEVAEEGRRRLSRMPKLESQRELRKDYRKLADGDLGPDDFAAARDKLLEATRLPAAAASKFAAKVIDATEVIESDYYREENQGELVARGVHKLYQFVEEKIPDAIEARLGKVKALSGDQLRALLIDARVALGGREDLAKDKDIDVTLAEMLRTLDPYTTYVGGDGVEQAEQTMYGRFTGIGVQIRKDAATDLLLVVTPIKGSPAYKAGLQAGDLITKITREVDSNGNALSRPEVTDGRGLTVADAVKKILGQPDTKVVLTVRREGVDGTKDYEITRGRVEVESVFGVKRNADDGWDFMLDREKKIGYLRLSQFKEDSHNDIVAAMEGLRKQGLEGFVLDLRFNPGGTVQSAEDISDLFMDDGVIVSIRSRGKAEDFVRGKHEGSLLDFPMVCLVNGESASASEIVAACLQDHRRAYVVGERSFGKGSVQNVRKFGDGELKLTTGTFWRPSGKNLDKRLLGAVEMDEWGVKPDEVVPLTEKERGELSDELRNHEIIPRRDAPVRTARDSKPEFKDRQLERAIEYLAGRP